MSTNDLYLLGMDDDSVFQGEIYDLCRSFKYDFSDFFEKLPELDGRIAKSRWSLCSRLSLKK